MGVHKYKGVGYRKVLLEVKECNHCHIEKDKDQFHVIDKKDAKGNSYQVLSAYCLICEPIKQKEAKEKRSKGSVRKQTSMVLTIEELPLEKPCKKCGEVKEVRGGFEVSKRTLNGIKYFYSPPNCKVCEQKRRKELTQKKYNSDSLITRTYIPDEKECTKCKIVKPKDDFFIIKRFYKQFLNISLTCWCKECSNKNSRKYYARVIKKQRQDDILPETKKCSCCHQPFPIKNFVVEKRIRKDGSIAYYTSKRCRKCLSKQNRKILLRSKKKLKRYKEYQKEYQKSYVRKPVKNPRKPITNTQTV